jgi:hypothetical protein
VTDDLATLIAELGARQDRAVERLTAAVAKVLSEASRADQQARAEQMAAMERVLLHAIDGAAARASAADRQARHDDAESLRSELAGTLGALQAGVIERVGHASSADAQALRRALSAGFDRVGERVTEALRTELTRLQVSLLERLPQAPDGTVIDPRQELLSELQRIGGELTSALERGFGSMRSTLAEAAHDGRAAADGVAAIVSKVADLSQTVERTADAERSLTDARVDKLRTELAVSLGALEQAYREPVEALQAPLHKATAAVEAASMARALEATTIHDEIAAGLTELAGRLEALEAELQRLVGLVGQLWGGEP